MPLMKQHSSECFVLNKQSAEVDNLVSNQFNVFLLVWYYRVQKS